MGLRYEIETAVVNELSVFEPLKFFCIMISRKRNKQFTISRKTHKHFMISGKDNEHFAIL